MNAVVKAHERLRDEFLPGVVNQAFGKQGEEIKIWRQ